MRNILEVYFLILILHAHCHGMIWEIFLKSIFWFWSYTLIWFAVIAWMIFIFNIFEVYILILDGHCHSMTWWIFFRSIFWFWILHVDIVCCHSIAYDKQNKQFSQGSPYLQLKFVQDGIRLMFSSLFSYISFWSFTFSGSPYRIFLICLLRLPCHFYLVIEQQQGKSLIFHQAAGIPLQNSCAENEKQFA